MPKSMPLRSAATTLSPSFCSISHVPCPMSGTSRPDGPKRWYSTTTPSRSKLHLFEILVHELDGHGALADCGSDSLDGTGSHVPGGKDAGMAGLQQERASFRRPVRRVSKLRARADKPLRIQL